jgi:hypothetical protein
MMAKRSSTLVRSRRSIVFVAVLAAGYLASLGGLGGCGGGSGGGGGEGPRVIFQALVADGPSACTIQAEVDGGSGANCGGIAGFELFDADGSELNIDALSNVFLLPVDRRASFALRICRYQTGGVALIPENDSCSTVPTFLNPETLVLYPPPRDVSCEEFSRVQTNVIGCED